MWLVVIGAVVLVIVIVLIREALGYEMTTKPGLSMQENKREGEKLVNRWFSGNRLPEDEEQMFEEFYEGDFDNPMWS